MIKGALLFVEDNPDDEELTLRTFRQYLEENEVVVAHDGVEALDYLFNTCLATSPTSPGLPKVILLDLKLSKVNGFDVLKRVRADPRTQHLPIVIFTSSNEEGDIRNSYQLGANSYVCKPVEYQRYAESVQKVGFNWLTINQAP